MFCPNCGFQLNEGAQFCPSCGNPVAFAGTPIQENAPSAPSATSPNAFGAPSSVETATQTAPAAAVGFGAAANTAQTSQPSQPTASEPFNPYANAQPSQPSQPTASEPFNPYASAQDMQYPSYWENQNAASSSYNTVDSYGTMPQPPSYGSAPGAPEPPLRAGSGRIGTGGNDWAAPYSGYSAASGAPAASPTPPQKKSKAPIIIAIVVIVAVVAGIFVFMNGNRTSSPSPSGGGTVSTPAPSSEYASLEDYFDKNPSEWDDIISSINSADSSQFTIDIDIDGNMISEIVRFTIGFSDSEREEMRATFETDESIEDMKAQLADVLSAVENSTGLSGLSWYVEYQDTNGDLIWNTVVFSN